MDEEEEREDDQDSENKQKGVLGINGYDQKYQESQEDQVVDDHEERNPQKGDEQALENAGNGGHGVGERHWLWCVERSDGEDHGGGGEERESEEEDEVEELEEEEEGPLVTGLGRVGLRGLELGEKWMGE